MEIPVKENPFSNYAKRGSWKFLMEIADFLHQEECICILSLIEHIQTSLYLTISYKLLLRLTVTRSSTVQQKVVKQDRKTFACSDNVPNYRQVMFLQNRV